MAQVFTVNYKVMTNEQIIKEYPIQDEIWPSRRWNTDKTDYVDMSGHEDYLDRVKSTDVNYKGQRLCKCKGCPNNSNEFTDYCNSCYDEKYPTVSQSTLDEIIKYSKS
jgi:hypothetical protein